MLKQIDASLARLRTDYVDLYQCHRYDWDTPLEETMQALTEVVRAGKARYLGFSEWPAEKIEEALRLPGVEKFVSSQPQYSMIWRGPERDVIPALRRERHLADRLVAARAGSPHRASTSPASRRPRTVARSSEQMNYFMDASDDEVLLERVQRLRPIAEGLGLSLAQLALAWVLREPNVASAIIGASRPAAGAGQCGRLRGHARRGDARSRSTRCSAQRPV